MRYIIITGFMLAVTLLSFRTSFDFTIKGKVTDVSTGKALSGVTVKEKGTIASTVTDGEGRFSLTVQKEKTTLIFQHVGYEPREVVVKNDGQPLQVRLTAAVAQLDEVVVTGYQTAHKREYRKANEAAPALRALQGRVAGVAVSRGSRSKQVAGVYDPYNHHFNREGYDAITENRFLKATDNPLSTFSIDVDAASYSNIRRMLNMGELPPAGAVRIEEMINYFRYNYPQPTGEDPFSINTEISACPWNTQHKLVLIGLQGKTIATEELPPSNLVFLIDVSGSMMAQNKLPLVQQSMKLLIDQLRPQDKVAIVVYAGNAGLVLPSTNGSQKIKIKDAIDQLEAGGSTAGGAGIQLAYKEAGRHFIEGGNNRVILCTDGDFNVGASSDDALERMIEKERESGVYLTVLGYGTGNYQDAKMQKLADKGNGNHAYIDNFMEARKVLVSEFGGTLFTIAKDVKLQIEFNPAKVQAYRLIGYENRLLNKEDFNNDKKDAGDLGSGHTVTALYEVIPVGVTSKFIEPVDKLKYRESQELSKAAGSREIMTVKFRYKKPDAHRSLLIEHPVIDEQLSINRTSNNFRFAAAVAELGMLLRQSEFRQSASYESAWRLAKNALGTDPEGYRSEFLKLLKSAESLAVHDSPQEEKISRR